MGQTMKLFSWLIILNVILKTVIAGFMMIYNTKPEEALTYFIAYLLGFLLTAWMCDEYRRIEVNP